MLGFTRVANPASAQMPRNGRAYCELVMAGAVRTAFAVGVFTLLCGCNDHPAPNDSSGPRADGARALPDDAGALMVCKSVRDASEGGRSALQAAALKGTNPLNRNDALASEILRKNSVRFIGAELNRGHCWAYGQVLAFKNGATTSMIWRCPVTVISESLTAIGNTVLEDVDGTNCEINVVRGTDTHKAVIKPLTRLR